MKKKILAIVMSVVLVFGIVCAFTACGDDKQDDGQKIVSDMEYIKEKGTMVIGITEYAPMNFKAEVGSWTGFDTEFAEAV